MARLACDALTPARRAAEAACDPGDLYGSTSACPALPRRRPGVQCTPRLWPSKIVPILALSPFGDLFRGNKPPAHQSAFRDEFPTVKGYSKRVLTVLAVAAEAIKVSKDGQSHPRSDSVLRNVVVGRIAPPSTSTAQPRTGQAARSLTEYWLDPNSPDLTETRASQPSHHHGCERGADEGRSRIFSRIRPARLIF